MWVWKVTIVVLVLLLMGLPIDQAFGQHGHGGGMKVKRVRIGGGHGGGGSKAGRGGHGRGGGGMSLSPGQIQALRRMGVKRDMEKARASFVAAQNAMGYASHQQQKASNKLQLLESSDKIKSDELRERLLAKATMEIQNAKRDLATASHASGQIAQVMNKLTSDYRKLGGKIPDWYWQSDKTTRGGHKAKKKKK